MRLYDGYEFAEIHGNKIEETLIEKTISTLMKDYLNHIYMVWNHNFNTDDSENPIHR